MSNIIRDIEVRMKRYKSNADHRLMWRNPVILHIDGKAFHTYTRNFERPVDEGFRYAMAETMKYLCENIQGCVFGYTQSDEISLVLVDYKKLNTQPWFGYRISKLASITASMASCAFNKAIKEVYEDANSFAVFACAPYSIPRDEVTNDLYWRQIDAIRNSIESFGQAHFSTSQLHKKSQSDIKKMLIDECGINWDSLPIDIQRGSACIKEEYYINKDGVEVDDPDESCSRRTRWVIDKKIPLFVGDGRGYIDARI